MHKYSRVRVGVGGVTGYTGIELMRRLARHPHVDLRVAMASSGSQPRRLPALARIWDAPVEPMDLGKLAAETDAIFLALPDSVSAEIAPGLAIDGRRVFDLSGAFRLRDAELRGRWYPHTGAMNGGTTYGLTERYRNELKDASLIACAGCYPTAAILSLAPLLDRTLISSRGLIVDAKSGVSGVARNTASSAASLSRSSGCTGASQM